VNRVRSLAVAIPLAAACGTSDNAATKQAVASSSAPAIAAVGSSQCPSTGLWAQCSVLYRLDRAGVAPRLDSTAKPEEKRLTGTSFLVKIGRIASLDVFIYPDSMARRVDGAKLDTTQFVDGQATQTIRRERTLIQNGNLIALLTSLNERQRERVANALGAGAPQPGSQ